MSFTDLSTLFPAGESWRSLLLCIASVYILFLLSEVVARMTIVYKRHNLAVFFAFVLAASGFYFLGFAGLLAFVAGTFTGALTWVSSVEAANRRVHSVLEAGNSPARPYGVLYHHRDNHHAVNGT